MRKVIFGVVAALALAGAAFAETDAKALQVINDIQKGRNNANQIDTLRVLNSGTFGGAVSAESFSGAVSGNGTSVTNINAANLAAGSTASAINGASITNLGAAKLAAGSTASAINGAAITNLGSANMIGASGTSAILTNITVCSVPASVLRMYDLLQLTGSTTTNATFASVTLDAPGVANVGRRVTIYTGVTNSVTITANSELVSPRAMVLTNVANSITVIGNTAASWLCTDVNIP